MPPGSAPSPGDARSATLPADGTPTIATPTITALQARANAYARREEQRFFSRCRRDLAEQRGLAQALAADLDAYDDRLEALAPAERAASQIAEGDGVAFEELRRLRRRIAQRNARAEQLGASINARYIAARLRASRHFDRSDEKIAVYWSAYLRAATPPPGAVRAPALHRADSLAGRETSVDIWRPVEPAGTRGGSDAARAAGTAGATGTASVPSVEPGRPDART